VGEGRRSDSVPCAGTHVVAAQDADDFAIAVELDEEALLHVLWWR
jgi:hypothetical protein